MERKREGGREGRWTLTPFALGKGMKDKQSNGGAGQMQPTDRTDLLQGMFQGEGLKT